MEFGSKLRVAEITAATGVLPRPGSKAKYDLFLERAKRAASF